MQIQELISTFKSHKAQNLRAIWGKQLKTRKGVTDIVEKLTSIIVRGGIDYDNIAVVQEKRESGDLPQENAGLSWGEWVEFPYHIAHKGTDYIRLYPASGIPFAPKVEYYLNGVLVEKDKVQHLCLASEFPNREEQPLCFTVKAENVKAILV